MKKLAFITLAAFMFVYAGNLELVNSSNKQVAGQKEVIAYQVVDPGGNG